MLSSSPTSSGHRNWKSLSLQQQFKAANWAAHWILTHKKLLLFSSSTVGVGAGPRERTHGKGKRYVKPEIVLTVEVKQKTSPDKCKDDVIPRHIQLKVPVGNHRLVLALPTDVRERPSIPTAQADPYKLLSQSGWNGVSVNGSLCALVRNTTGNTELRYVLTCHHVAFLSLLNANFNPDSSAVCFHQKGNATVGRMGKSSRGAALVRSPRFSVDAGLIRLDKDSPASKLSYWSVVLTNWVKDNAEIREAFTMDPRVYNRRMNGHPIELSQLKQDVIVDYKGGGRARFSQLIEYRIPAGTETLQGDSGGALISARFKLIGMHIAGNARFGYATPAYQLLRTTAFTPSITLAIPEAA